MDCPDIERLISFALASRGGSGDDGIAGHLLECPACRAALEIVHETMLAEKWRNPEPAYQSVAEAECRVYSWGDETFDPPEMIVTLAGFYTNGWSRNVRCAETVTPEFSAAMRPLCATRALGGAQTGDAPSKLSFVKRGEECSLKIELSVLDSGADVSLRLISHEGEPILPFSLSVLDDGSGETLLEEREFRSGAAVLRGVQKGVYLVKAEGRGRICRFSFKVD